jgi:hypothetical protein
MHIPASSTLYCDVMFVPNTCCTYSCARLPTCSSSLKPSIEIAELQLRMAKPPAPYAIALHGKLSHHTRSQSRTFDCAYVPEYSCVNGVRDVLEDQGAGDNIAHAQSLQRLSCREHTTRACLGSKECFAKCRIKSVRLGHAAVDRGNEDAAWLTCKNGLVCTRIKGHQVKASKFAWHAINLENRIDGGIRPSVTTVCSSRATYKGMRQSLLDLS